MSSAPGDIAFHFNVRFASNMVVCNASFGGDWGEEVREENNFPFTPGENFDLVIACDPDALQVRQINSPVSCRHGGWIYF